MRRWIWPIGPNLTWMGFERSISSDSVRGASYPRPPSFLSPFMGSPPPPFILVFSSRSSHTCPFLLVWGGYLSYQSIRQNGWEKLNGMVWVWVCQALGSTLRCWQLSSLCCSCTESVLFFRRCWETLDVKSSSATSLGLQGASLRVLGNRAPRPGL